MYEIYVFSSNQSSWAKDSSVTIRMFGYGGSSLQILHDGDKDVCHYSTEDDAYSAIAVQAVKPIGVVFGVRKVK